MMKRRAGAWALGSGWAGAGVAGAFQTAASLASSRGLRVAASMAPTTKRDAPSGRQWAAWNALRSAGVSVETVLA
jgi:hypothetical protein